MPRQPLLKTLGVSGRMLLLQAAARPYDDAVTYAAAFAGFYQQHRDAVLAYHWQRVRHWQDAEDLAELTFTKALAGWQRCPYPADSRKPWLLRIARNVAIDHFRAAGLRSTADLAGLAELAGSADPAREAEAAAIRDSYRCALTSLPVQQRRIAARFFAGMRERDIAHDLGLTRGAVKSAVYRIRRILRRHLALQAWAP